MIEKPTDRSPETALVPEAPPDGAAAAPAPAPAPAATVAPAPVAVAPPARQGDELGERLGTYEREAKALGSDPGAARLFHEIGRLWEEQKSPRNAAIAYQNAYRLNPRLLPNLQSARRLFTEVGNWQMVAQLLDAEAAVMSEPAARARLVFEKGLVLEERLGRVDEALTCYEKALELAPDSIAVLEHLEAHHADAKTPLALAEVYQKTAAALTDHRLKAHCLAAAAGLLEDRAGKAEEAVKLWREAFAQDRRHPVVIAQLRRHAEKEGRFDELVEVLAAEAELDATTAAPVYYRMAKVYRDRLGREEDAVAALLAARRVSPGDPLVLGELARVYEAQGRWEDLADVLKARAAAIGDESELVGINLRLGALYEEKLDRRDEAIERYRMVVALVPGHGPALAALGKLYWQRADWAGLLQTYEAEVAYADDPKQKVAKMYKAAEILEEKLSREEEAIAQYNAILQLLPGYLPAQKALTRLYERKGSFAELVAMLEQDLTTLSDRDQTIATLQKIAEILEERLDDTVRAIDALKRILQVAPDHLPTIRAVARLAEKAKQWEELIQANELEVVLTGDQRHVVSLLHRNCEILEEAIGDKDRAIEAYRKVLALSPAYLPALKALGKLYAQKGRWADLVEMYRQESEVAPTSQAAATLVFKIGELYESRLQDQAKAIEAYREVLSLSPAHPEALRALASIFRGQKDWQPLVEVLREEASVVAEPTERANILFRTAEILEEQLGRTDDALHAYQDVLQFHPGHAPAIRALERLYSLSGAHKELVHLYEREASTAPVGGKIAAYLRLSRLYLDRLNDPPRAAQCCEAILNVDPGNVLALKTLDRIRGAQGDRNRRADVRSRLALRTTDRRAAATLLLAAAADRERAAPNTSTLDELKKACELDPSDERARDALERALRKVADHAGLVSLLERRIAATTDLELKLALLVQVGELRERHLGDLEGAVAGFREALQLDPGHLPALRALRRVFGAAGDRGALRGVLQLEGRAARDVGHSVECSFAAGQLAEELGDGEAAIADYREVLARDPLEARAAGRLEELLAARGGAEEIANLYEQRAAAVKSPQDAANDLVGAARVWMDRLGNPEKAGALLEAALARVPAHGEALERRGQLSFQLGRWQEAAQAYAARVQQGGDAKHLAGIHHRLGTIYARHLPDQARAVAHLQTALSAEPALAPALELLAEIHVAARNHAGAADALRRLVELEKDPPALARHHLALAQVLDEGFGDVPAAVQSYQAALDLVPADTAPIERLAALYERLGDLPRLVGVLERQAETLARTDRPAAVAMHTRCAQLLAGQLSEPARAIEAYQRALALAPEDARTRAAMAELYARQPSGIAQAIEEHRTLLRADPLRVESYRALFQLWEKQGQHDRAFVAASVLQYLRSADGGETAYCAQLQGMRPAEPSGVLSDDDVRGALLHAGERTPVADVIRAVGDQLSRIYPPQLDRYQVGRGDKPRPDHPVRRLFDRLCASLALPPDEFELYMSRAQALALAVEGTEPLSVVIGVDIPTRYQKREQMFLLGRVAFRVSRKNAFLDRTTGPAEIADVICAAVRQIEPAFSAIGRPNDELTKRVNKGISRKGRRLLEEPARALAASRGPHDVAALFEGARLSADRAGLLLSGDVVVALSMVARADPQAKIDTPEGAAAALRGRKDGLELLQYVMSEEHFRLRTKLKVGAA